MSTKFSFERSTALEVPETIFRRHSARLAIVPVRADFAGNLPRTVHVAYVELHERGVGRGTNRDGFVRGLAIEFEDCGRGHADSVRAVFNRRAEFANSARRRNFFVADIFVAVHVEVPVLPHVSIDIRA